MHEALLWRSEGERVRCLLCPHDCRISVGNRGICGVRENRDGRLVALTYGLVSSVAIDPIEKKHRLHDAMLSLPELADQPGEAG
jgi:pyruvate formate lyase activating enzyme